MIIKKPTRFALWTVLALCKHFQFQVYRRGECLEFFFANFLPVLGSQAFILKREGFLDEVRLVTAGLQ